MPLITGFFLCRSKPPFDNFLIGKKKLVLLYLNVLLQTWCYLFRKYECQKLQFAREISRHVVKQAGTPSLEFSFSTFFYTDDPCWLKPNITPVTYNQATRLKKQTKRFPLSNNLLISFSVVYGRKELCFSQQHTILCQASDPITAL